MAASSVKFYNAWFCPFAQRAWIALLHREVDFEYVEQDPYDKSSEWLAINPRGLVPAIVHNGNVVTESPVCIEYVHEAWTSGKPLLPENPFQRALVRIWSDQISKKIVPHYYAFLQKESTEDREKAKEEILSNLNLLLRAMSSDGPFFLGQHFGMVDIMLAPYAYRFETVLQHYRSFDMPKNETFARYHVWWEAVKEVESVKATMQDKVKLIAKYQRYADNTAKSEVANAIRKGTTLP